MRQTAYVIETDGDEATVESERASSCGSCAGKASCNTLGSWNQKERQSSAMRLRVDNTLGAKAGDEVVIEVADGLVLKTAFRLYAMPMLIFIIIGGLVWQGFALQGSDKVDLAASLSGILAVLTYYGWIWKRGAPEGFDAKVVEVRGCR